MVVMISMRTEGVAVAVSKMIGTLGYADRMWER